MTAFVRLTTAPTREWPEPTPILIRLDAIISVQPAPTNDDHKAALGLHPTTRTVLVTDSYAMLAITDPPATVRALLAEYAIILQPKGTPGS